MLNYLNTKLTIITLLITTLLFTGCSTTEVSKEVYPLGFYTVYYTDNSSELKEQYNAEMLVGLDLTPSDCFITLNNNLRKLNDMPGETCIYLSKNEGAQKYRIISAPNIKLNPGKNTLVIYNRSKAGQVENILIYGGKYNG